MSEFVNNLGQPAGAPMDEWHPALPPPRGAMEQWLALANFDARGVNAGHCQTSPEPRAMNWTTDRESPTKMVDPPSHEPAGYRCLPSLVLARPASACS